MTPPTRVTVAVHDAQRTGPPIYALDVVTWLGANTDLDLTVLLVEGGPLEADFAATCPTVLVDDAVAARAALERADVVYVNTAASIQALAHTGVRPRRVLSHVHEMDIALRHYLDPADHDLLIAATDRFLVGPDCARRNLVTGHGVAEDRIGQVPYFVPRHGPVAAEAGAALRAEQGIPEEAIVVGACGTREWRKAPDLFAQAAWALTRRTVDVPVHFVWMGSRIPSVEHWDEGVDVPLLGLEGRISFVENQPDPLPWMSAFDIFALTSREDTFPLVCLEAGSLAKPVVCFDTSGIPEMLAAADGGLVVPFLDLEAFAGAIETLATDEDRRTATGRRLQAHIAVHHDIDRCVGLVADEILGMVA